ncbi:MULTISPECIES: hypothetical protein [unclassified Caballeronia]|uniref:hypothetical protein n=1 Tax=unclassified Caballeronia TaxID=2646786 RepID=UPI0020293797|nr:MULTISPECIES: hypothetical protein [unclassified Caballeronia]
MPEHNFKPKIVCWLLDHTHRWNKALHEEIEIRIHRAHAEMYPRGNDEADVTINRMREFYYQRMMMTAMLLLSASALVVALASLVVSVIALRTH